MARYKTGKPERERERRKRKRAINSGEAFIPDRPTHSLTGSVAVVPSVVEGSTLLRFHSLSSRTASDGERRRWFRDHCNFPEESRDRGGVAEGLSREGMEGAKAEPAVHL